MADTLIAIVSDVHAGSTIALCPPSIALDDGGEYHASKAQSWLWGRWLGYWEWIEQLRDKYKADLLTEFNGDLVEGDHHGTTQIITGNPTAQGKVWDACVSVPLSLGPNAMYFIRGTEAHVGKSASAEERIASGLLKDKRPVVPDPDTGTASHWKMRLEVEGVRLEFAHHGRMGTRPWTRINVTANLAAEIFYEYSRDGEPHPHVAIRSHLHQYVDTGDAHPVRVIQTPCFQIATAHVHRIAAENLADVGGIALLIRDGEVERLKYIRRPSRPTVVKYG